MSHNRAHFLGTDSALPSANGKKLKWRPGEGWQDIVYVGGEKNLAPAQYERAELRDQARLKAAKDLDEVFYERRRQVYLVGEPMRRLRTPEELKLLHPRALVYRSERRKLIQEMKESVADALLVYRDGMWFQEKTECPVDEEGALVWKRKILLLHALAHVDE